MHNKNRFGIALAFALILPLFAHAESWWEDNLDPTL